MKTSSTFRPGIFALLFVVFSNHLRSQTPNCNYRVDNHINCPVEVLVEYYTAGPTLCETAGPIQIGAGGSYVFNCQTPPSNCTFPLANIKVTLVSVQGHLVGAPNSYMGPPVNFTGMNTGAFLNQCGTVNRAKLRWNYDNLIIDPAP